MNLLTDAQRCDLLAAGITADETGECVSPCTVKLFDPCGRWTYYAFHAEPAVTIYSKDDLMLFGFAVSPLGPDCDEWGYQSLAEIEAAKGQLGIGMERDLHFSGVTAEQINAGHRAGTETGEPL